MLLQTNTFLLLFCLFWIASVPFMYRKHLKSKVHICLVNVKILFLASPSGFLKCLLKTKMLKFVCCGKDKNVAANKHFFVIILFVLDSFRTLYVSKQFKNQSFYLFSKCQNTLPGIPQWVFEASFEN